MLFQALQNILFSDRQIDIIFYVMLRVKQPDLRLGHLQAIKNRNVRIALNQDLFPRECHRDYLIAQT